jgi:formaldehyde-activating enzyme involved in methanogenesis
MNEKLKALVQSRRFWVAIAGVATVVTQSLGITQLTQDQVEYVVLLAASWIVGDSIRKTEVLNP